MVRLKKKKEKRKREREIKNVVNWDTWVDNYR